MNDMLSVLGKAPDSACKTRMIEMICTAFEDREEEIAAQLVQLAQIGA